MTMPNDDYAMTERIRTALIRHRRVKDCEAQLERAKMNLVKITDQLTQKETRTYMIHAGIPIEDNRHKSRFHVQRPNKQKENQSNAT